MYRAASLPWVTPLIQLGMCLCVSIDGPSSVLVLHWCICFFVVVDSFDPIGCVSIDGLSLVWVHIASMYGLLCHGQLLWSLPPPRHLTQSFGRCMILPAFPTLCRYFGLSIYFAMDKLLLDHMFVGRRLLLPSWMRSNVTCKEDEDEYYDRLAYLG